MGGCWLVVGGFGWLWVVVAGCGWLLAACGWLLAGCGWLLAGCWLVVGGCGWLRVLVYPIFYKLINEVDQPRYLQHAFENIWNIQHKLIILIKMTLINFKVTYQILKINSEILVPIHGLHTSYQDIYLR